MSILAYNYQIDVVGSDLSAVMDIPTPLIANPPQAQIMVYDTGIPNSGVESWKRRWGYDNAGNNPAGAFKQDTVYWTLAAAIPPASTEIWIRFLDYDSYPAIALDNYWNWYATVEVARFYNLTNGVWSLVAQIILYPQNSNVYYNVFAADGTTVVKQHIISSSSLIRTDNATGDCIVDFRFKFDKVAGFIQHYDFSASRVKEVLGQTINDLPVTHILLSTMNLLCKSSTWSSTVSRIIADEPTFGMYVMPFYAKGEGTSQQQEVGTYTRFSKGRKNFDSSWGVTLKKPTDNSEVKYSYLPKNLTEMGLPVNHNVLSMSIHASFDGTSATGDPIPTDIFLKDISTGNLHSIATTPAKTNISSSISGSPQVKVARWDKNPVTNQNWTPTDLSSFEIGFKI